VGPLAAQDTRLVAFGDIISRVYRLRHGDAAERRRPLELLRETDDRGCAAPVLLEFLLSKRDSLCFAERLKSSEALDVGPAEAVHCLVVIAHDRQAGFRITQPAGVQHELDRVGRSEEHTSELQ